MSKDTIQLEKEAMEIAPIEMKRYANNEGKTLAEIFPDDGDAAIRSALKDRGVVVTRRRDRDIVFAADVGEDGKVLSMAAAVSRTPVSSETFLRDNVPDLQASASSRKDRIALFQRIYASEGTINNAIKKKAALVSQDGSYSIRSARQGKRPKANVSSELMEIYQFWLENVNSAPEDGAITGSRGMKQIIRRGSRQAMVEGDLFLREVWRKVNIPHLGKAYSLPIVLHALPAADVEIAEDFTGLGYELFYWVPSSDKIRNITNPRDPDLKKVIQKTVSSDILNQLRKNRKAKLDPSLLLHIKHAGTDSESYGQSDVEAAMTDIAYARALKSLDFVTINSLVNRMLVIKIGDQNPESAYHNLNIAQSRVKTFANLIREVGPNMLLLWAGHDVDTKDIGAHQSVLDTNRRHELAGAAIKLATGVPDSLLTGGAAGGNSVAWAGLISLGAVVAELQEEWTQSLTQLGMRIAEQNGFKDVEIAWQFNHRLLADVEANSKLMGTAFQFGAISRRTYVEELGKDYDVERARRTEEIEEGDDEMFMPINAQGGPTGDQGPNPDSTPGRPDKTSDPDKVGPDRDREDKTLNTPQE